MGIVFVHWQKKGSSVTKRLFFPQRCLLLEEECQALSCSRSLPAH